MEADDRTDEERIQAQQELLAKVKEENRKARGEKIAVENKNKKETERPSTVIKQANIKVN